MTDSVSLLRHYGAFLSNADRRRIADEIEQLRGENEKLRAPASQLAKTKRPIERED